MRSHAVRALRNATGISRVYSKDCRFVSHGVRWSSTSTSTGRQWSTPLAKSLAQIITTTGPVSVAAYMRQCLTADEGGYYTRHTTGHDQFGAKGDFITSPEISQVFGELVGIWLFTEWLAQGRRSEGVQIIEVGPGRGTLMDDVLRTISNFKPFANSVENIYLVEASPHLRTQQAQLLSGTTNLTENDFGWTAPCKYLPGCNIVWCEDIRLIPKDEYKSPFILAHEFFDALPIHIFQNVASSSIPASSTIMTPTGPIKPKTGPQAPANQWHELVVSPVSPYESSSTSASSPSTEPESKKEEDDFHLTISKSPTPHSLYLPQTSARYKALAKIADAVIEISPESLAYVSDFATRIGGSNPVSQTPQHQASSKDATATNKTTTVSSPTILFNKPNPSGAALILDYGSADTIPSNTLRGIRSHRPVSPFSSPGLVDISADVDFLALAETAISASPGVEVHGPVEQAFFLGTMGIAERVERLVKGKGDSDPETVKRVEGAWKRLVDRGPTGMGRIYKVMAIVPYKENEVRRPVGFGGDVVG